MRDPIVWHSSVRDVVLAFLLLALWQDVIAEAIPNEALLHEEHYQITHRYQDLAPQIQEVLAQWFSEQMVLGGDVRVADFGEPYRQSVLRDDVPKLQHQFTASFRSYNWVLFRVPSPIAHQEQFLLVLFDVERRDEVCGFLFPPELGVRSFDELQSSFFFESRVEGSRFPCLPLSSLSLDK